MPRHQRFFHDGALFFLLVRRRCFFDIPIGGPWVECVPRFPQCGHKQMCPRCPSSSTATHTLCGGDHSPDASQMRRLCLSVLPISFVRIYAVDLPARSLLRKCVDCAFPLLPISFFRIYAVDLPARSSFTNASMVPFRAAHLICSHLRC